MASAAEIADLSSVLTSYERSFEAQHGRKPTASDLTPAMRENYLQYKLLRRGSSRATRANAPKMRASRAIMATDFNFTPGLTPRASER